MLVLSPETSTAVNSASMVFLLGAWGGGLMEYLVEYSESDNDEQATDDAGYRGQKIGANTCEVGCFDKGFPVHDGFLLSVKVRSGFAGSSGRPHRPTPEGASRLLPGFVPNQ